MKNIIQYEFIKEHIENTGYQLLTTKDRYINTGTEIVVKCPFGHEYKVKWHHFKDNGRCGKCKNVSRYLLDEVKTYVESRGYKLLSKEYKNNKQELNFACKDGHELAMKLNQFKNCTIPCKVCRSKKENNKWRLKYSYVDVKKYIEDQSCKLLTTEEEYINTREKLAIQCNKGHIFNMEFHIFKQNHGCPECANENLREKFAFTYEYVKNYIETESGNGYTLISHEYINSQSPLIVMCPKGHQYPVRFDSFKNSESRCKQCLGLSRLDGQFVYNEFINKGLTPMFKPEEYKNNSSSLPYICLKHKDKSIQYISFDRLSRATCGCFYCGYEKVAEGMKGEKHPLWKGGITSLHHRLRNELEINNWKLESLKSNNYKCILTGYSGKNLNVHHLFGFSLILQKVLTNSKLRRYKTAKEYTDSEYSLIKSGIIEEHNLLLGVPIRKDLHKLFHNLYGSNYTIPEQFEDFKQRFLKGEFTSIVD